VNKKNTGKEDISLIINGLRKLLLSSVIAWKKCVIEYLLLEIWGKDMVKSRVRIQ